MKKVIQSRGRSVANFPNWRFGFDPRVGYTEFAVGEVATVQVFF
jgi:hypothetical protein